MGSLGPTASDTYGLFPDFMYKYCHHTWFKFCFSFLFNIPVGLPFSAGMLQLLLLCNKLSPSALALRPSFCLAGVASLSVRRRAGNGLLRGQDRVPSSLLPSAALTQKSHFVTLSPFLYFSERNSACCYIPENNG